MIHVICCKGMQASGKSTWAKQFVKEHQDYKRVNRDSFRTMLSDYTFDDINEKLVTKFEDAAIQLLIDNKYNIIIDNMHLNEKYLNQTMTWIKDYCYHKHNEQVEFEIKEFPITLGEAIERDAKRPDSLGKEILKKTWHKYEVELKQMIERAKPKYEDANKNLPICIVCDIDGTLSNSSGRRVFDENLVHTDKVINPVRDILSTYEELNYHTSSMYKIFIMSGRKDSCRAQTEEWLRDNAIPFHDLYMRASDDNRDDTIVKRELYEKHIKGKYRVLFVVDDRIKVLDMWQRNGLFTLDVRQDAFAKNNF